MTEAIYMDHNATTPLRAEVLEPSHVLLAMGVPPLITQGSRRFSLGRTNTAEQVDRMVEALTGIVEPLQAASPLSVEETGV